jgi:glycine/D-amino acid oxidase-like deaminating enzyme
VAEYDAVIVGAGIVGLATAYYIKKKRPNDKILIVDKMNAAGQGNTAKSAAMFRCFFYSNTNLTLADSSIEFYRYVQEKLGVNLGIRWTGYLWLYQAKDYEIIEPVLKTMAIRGMKYEIYDKKELAEKLKIRVNVTDDEEAKIMGLANVDLGVFIPKAGAIDVDALVKFYETEFLKMNGKISYSTSVKSILVEPETSFGIPGEPYFWQRPTVTGVETSRGIIKAKKTIVAAGSWTPLLLDPIGIESYIKPKKRQIFSVKAKTEELKSLLWSKGFNKEGCIPFTILPCPRVYLKPALEEEAFWFSYADDFPRGFKHEEDPQPEENFYQYGMYQIAVKYFPQFIGSSPFSSFAGLYEINTIDGQPLIFEENNVMIVGGASGSGIMKADAIGRIAAALYACEEKALLYGDREFKVSDLGIEKRKIEPEKLVI